MNIEQVRRFYEDKESEECPITEKLIKFGYQQEKGGYIDYANEPGVEVIYRNGKPSQWWHLIHSYCDRAKSNVTFSKRIQCGELIFWMAEAGDCVEKKELESLADAIIESGTLVKRRNEKRPKVRYDRRRWNKKIQELCFDEIVKKVESYHVNLIR